MEVESHPPHCCLGAKEGHHGRDRPPDWQKVSNRYEVLLQIGRIICARHVASPSQDGELAPLCQNAVDLDSEIKGLRQRLTDIVAAPLLPEDLAAEPVRKEHAQCAPN